MEWQIPIQKVEIGNIHMSNPWGRHGGTSGAGAAQQKPMVPLSYFGTQFRMPFMSILFPPLSVIEYSPASGRLVLDMGISPLACIKLNTLQETLINAIVGHQESWFQTHFTKEEVKDGFQPMIEHHHIVLHCPLYMGAKGGMTIPLYRASTAEVKDGSNAVEEKTTRKAVQTALTPSDLRPGQRIRVGVKIHGISFLTNQAGHWTGRCRLQHRVQGVIALA